MGYPRFRDRAVPEDPLRASARRLPSLRLLAFVVHVAGESEVRRAIWWRSSPTASSPSLQARDRAPPAHLRLRSGLVVHGHARLRPFPRAVAVVQALLGGVGAAARGGGEAALGAGQGGGPRGAASNWRARRFTRPTAWRCRGGGRRSILALGGFIFYNTNVLNEYHTASEGWSGAPSTSGATGSTKVSRNPG